MTEVPAVLAAIVAVNKAIAEQGIAKADENKQQGFKFRGVDAVYDAVAGPMAEHGLFSTSDVLAVERSERTSKGGGTLFLVYLTVRYTFWCATDGSSVATEVVAEAMDSGDKATAKAMSVAHRTALLQLSTAPVNPAEADADTYEVAAPDPEFAGRRDRVRALVVELEPEDRQAVLAWCKAEFEAGRLPDLEHLTAAAAATIADHILGTNTAHLFVEVSGSSSRPREPEAVEGSREVQPAGSELTRSGESQPADPDPAALTARDEAIVAEAMDLVSTLATEAKPAYIKFLRENGIASSPSLWTTAHAQAVRDWCWTPLVEVPA